MDVNYPVFPEVEGWSETRWVGAFSPESGAGLWLHAGRCRADLDLWWVQTDVYLPGERLVTGRSWCRAGEGEVVLDGNLRLVAEEEFKRFSVTFDGAGDLSTTQELALTSDGLGKPAPIRFTLDGAASVGPWDTFKGDNGGETWGSRHMQQLYSTTGSISFQGEELTLEGVGFIDHSSGPRSFTTFGGHVYLNVEMGGVGVHAMSFWNTDGAHQMTTGVLIDGESQRSITGMDMPGMSDALGHPHRFETTITDEDGVAVVYDVEILHTLPTTMTNDNDCYNGVNWTVSEDPLVTTECAARITAPDGTVGYGHVERSLRRHELQRD